MTVLGFCALASTVEDGLSGLVASAFFGIDAVFVVCDPNGIGVGVDPNSTEGWVLPPPNEGVPRLLKRPLPKDIPGFSLALVALPKPIVGLLLVMIVPPKVIAGFSLTPPKAVGFALNGWTTGSVALLTAVENGEINWLSLHNGQKTNLSCRWTSGCCRKQQFPVWYLLS